MQMPKSILLHLDSTAQTSQRVKAALRVAEAFDAEVCAMHGATPALLRFPTAIETTSAAVALLAELDEQTRKKARAHYEAASGGSPRLKWIEPGEDPIRDFSRRAFYCDLMVLGQRNPQEAPTHEVPDGFVPNLLIDTGKPALIVPYIGVDPALGDTVLIAWKESRESARAVTASLPWLRRARRVHVVCYAESADLPLQALKGYLSALGIDVTLHHGGPEPQQPGDNLLSLAADLTAGLLVMGCYGHSRAREWVLGGATRSILESMTLPVLMVH
jgi:nucleotide-binding universal stress UspA family protein